MRTASRVNACKRRVSSLSKRAMYIIRVDDLSLSRLILHGSRSRVTVQHPPSPPHPMCRVSVPPSSGRRLEKDWTNFIAAKAAPSLPPLPPLLRRSIRGSTRSWSVRSTTATVAKRRFLLNVGKIRGVEGSRLRSGKGEEKER